MVNAEAHLVECKEEQLCLFCSRHASNRVQQSLGLTTLWPASGSGVIDVSGPRRSVLHHTVESVLKMAVAIRRWALSFSLCRDKGATTSTSRSAGSCHYSSSSITSSQKNIEWSRARLSRTALLYPSEARRFIRHITVPSAIYDIHAASAGASNISQSVRLCTIVFALRSSCEGFS
jgi:hypothetical protein